VRCFTLFSSALFSLLCLASSVPLLPSLCLAILFVWFVGCLALYMGAALRVSLKLPLLVLSAQPISSVPALPPTVRYWSFLASPEDVLSTPHSALVSSQHAISFLPVVVILIVCFPLVFYFFYFFYFAYIRLFFHCYFPVCFLLFIPFIWLFFHFCPFISLYIFSFLFFACNMALSSQIVSCP
jgi:hypothetical protein